MPLLRSVVQAAYLLLPWAYGSFLVWRNNLVCRTRQGAPRSFAQLGRVFLQSFRLCLNISAGWFGWVPAGFFCLIEDSSIIS